MKSGTDQHSNWHIDASAFPQNGAEIEKLRFLLRYAILAPSNHNAQPWLFDLYDEHVDLIADRTRSLPATDPFDRELIISCGAALAFLQAAATGFGYELTIDRFPQVTNVDLLARVSFRNKQGFGGDKKIHEAILNRHTNRNAFESRLVPIEARNVIDLTMRNAGALTSWIDEASERKQLAEIIMTADQFQFENTAFLRELAAWVRPTQTSATDGIPSKAIGISGVASYVAPFLIRTFDMGAGKAARDMELMQCSPAVVIVSTPFDRDYDWLTCGEGLGFMLLAAEQLGLKASYLNQPCEVSELRFRLSLFDTVKGNPQLILRFGYAATVAPSPRRPLAQVVRERRKSIA